MTKNKIDLNKPIRSIFSKNPVIIKEINYMRNAIIDSKDRWFCLLTGKCLSSFDCADIENIPENLVKHYPISIKGKRPKVVSPNVRVGSVGFFPYYLKSTTTENEETTLELLTKEQYEEILRQ